MEVSIHIQVLSAFTRMKKSVVSAVYCQGYELDNELFWTLRRGVLED